MTHCYDAQPSIGQGWPGSSWLPCSGHTAVVDEVSRIYRIDLGVRPCSEDEWWLIGHHLRMHTTAHACQEPTMVILANLSSHYLGNPLECQAPDYL